MNAGQKVNVQIVKKSEFRIFPKLWFFIFCNLLKFNFMTFLLVQLEDDYINSGSAVKDLQNDTKIYSILSLKRIKRK